MSLRLKLLLLTLAAALPMVLGAFWLQAQARASALVGALEELAKAQLSAEERARCEAEPEKWTIGRLGPPGPPDGPRPPPPGDGRPPEGPWHERPPRGPAPGRPPMRGVAFFAYGTDGTSRNASAPVLPERLAGAVRGGAAEASDVVRDERGRERLQVVVRAPWGDGPCAYVLATRGAPREEEPLGPPAWLLGVVPILGALAAIYFGIGSVVTRLRRLEKAARDSARDGYAAPIPVEGRDELAQLARGFEEARGAIRSQLEQLAQRERTLREFLENTTHDVMIPMTVLLGHVASLRETAQAGKPAPPETVAALADEGHYLASLIHNLGAAAKLEGGAPQLSREPVDLSALVSRARGRHQPIARQHGVALDVALPESPLSTLGDVTLLEQAVSNLIYNAVRYNRPGGHVAVILEAAESGFVVRVLDDGPGVPEAQLASLVQRGFRGDAARTRQPMGQGLGLDIVHRVAEVHGFGLRFDKSSEGGLLVELSGPLAG